MRILVTAGNTQAPIDRVRCLTNVFSGRTGTTIAVEAWGGSGHHVTLATSRPEAIEELYPRHGLCENQRRWRLLPYRTFDELEVILKQQLLQENYDALIHSAAVSDYLASGVYAAAPGTSFSPETATWTGQPPTLLDRAAAKVKSDESELWIRLVRAPKLIDKVRTDWHFRGILVKFKLEVGVSEEQLLDIAERSRRQSDADLMVANTLEGSQTWALLGPNQAGSYEHIARCELAQRLLAAIDRKTEERNHG